MHIQSTIEGDFEGTDDEVVFTLDNGQKWQQIGYRYRYTYQYRPRVTIETSGPTGSMVVEGFSEPIRVRRIL